ncbi:hypothetical protein [Fluviicola sp.]|uniref:hypothetical protein n=1 Tax=Fluviicola sp. TaxID=1917219 RepID=UPI0026308A77|nr:hypothetical protein [Fluviicola sp.]
MKNFPIVCVVLFLTASCSSGKKFNKTDWNHRMSEGYYDKREAMLEDLLMNHPLKGKNIRQLRQLFGSDDLEVFKYDHQWMIQMNIITDYGWDIDPVYTKDLFVYLDKDSVVTSLKVKEWHKK